MVVLSTFIFKPRGTWVFETLKSLENVLSEAAVQRCSVKRGLLRNFAKFTGKHLCQSHFFNKVAVMRSAAFLKKRLWSRCFPVDFVKLLRTPFFVEYLWWLLQYFVRIQTKLSQETLLQLKFSSLCNERRCEKIGEITGPKTGIPFQKSSLFKNIC